MPSSDRVRFVHWNPIEAVRLAAALRSSGREVDLAVPRGPETLRELRKDPPAALVISLDRLPSQGRDFGVAVRRSAASRRVPIVFVGSSTERFDSVRRFLPDASFSSWAELAEVVRKATASGPLKDPVVPASAFAPYQGRSLTKKLGMAPGRALALVGAPSGFASQLGPLPTGVRWVREPGAPADLTLWFARSLTDVRRAFRARPAPGQDGRRWVLWKKGGRETEGAPTQTFVRTIGLAAGWVDYKICSVDGTWSGLLFRWRGRRGSVSDGRSLRVRPRRPTSGAAKPVNRSPR